MQAIVTILLVLWIFSAINNSGDVRLKQNVGIQIDASSGNVETSVQYGVNVQEGNTEIHIEFEND